MPTLDSDFGWPQMWHAHYFSVCTAKHGRLPAWPRLTAGSTWDEICSRICSKWPISSPKLEICERSPPPAPKQLNCHRDRLQITSLPPAVEDLTWTYLHPRSWRSRDAVRSSNVFTDVIEFLRVEIITSETLCPHPSAKISKLFIQLFSRIVAAAHLAGDTFVFIHVF